MSCVECSIYVINLPAKHNYSILNAYSFKILDRGWQLSSSLFVASDDLANVGKTLQEVSASRRLMNCLTQGLTIPWNSLASTAREMISSSSRTSYNLGKFISTKSCKVFDF
jgi:hypothetical protein